MTKTSASGILRVTLCAADTVKFVDEIFARYVPKPLPSTLSSAKSAVTGFGKQSANAFPIQPYESGSFGNQKPADKFNTSRKHSYHDANSYVLDSHYGNGNGVATKASRSKRVPRDSRTSGHGMSSQKYPPPAITTSYPLLHTPAPPTPPPGFPAFDANNPMAAFAIMQTMFPQMASMLPPSPSGEQGSVGNKVRCHDYDTKGYCTLGSSCPFEHGNDPIVAPREDEYDPTRANFSMNGTKRRTPGASNRPQKTRGASGGVQHFDGKRNNRAAFSDPRLPPDRNFTTIVVEQIPEECFEDVTVRDFFSQYGKVLGVTMKPYKRLAIVQYETHGAAKRAWESPKAVFDNRFVKVYWYRPELENAKVVPDDVSTSKDADPTMITDAVDEEAFKELQNEKQRAYEERMRTKRAMEDARQDLIRRREEMAKEREALVTKLAIAESHELGQSNTNGTKSLWDGMAADSPDPKIRALRDQLARMQDEARSLGIDPDAPSTDPLYSPSTVKRGGYGGPVRGGFAARAAYRGYGAPRGNYRGYGFVRGRDPSVRKLDNRPKGIVMSGVDFDTVKEENLRSYLTLIGPFEDIELNPQRTDSRIIVFKERWQAEQVMHGKSDIPGVGKVELSWVANIANGISAQTTSAQEDVVIGDAGDDARTFSEEAHQPRDDDLDVAGADDDEWGNIS